MLPVTVTATVACCLENIMASNNGVESFNLPPIEYFGNNISLSYFFLVLDVGNMCSLKCLKYDIIGAIEKTIDGNIYTN